MIDKVRLMILKNSVAIIGFVLTLFYSYFVWATSFILFFGKNAFCSTPEVSILWMLAIYVSPIVIVFTLSTRRWAIELKNFKPLNRKLINYFHLFVALSILGNWAIFVTIIFPLIPVMIADALGIL
jgi:hypothetical protein